VGGSRAPASGGKGRVRVLCVTATPRTKL
jgi:hypothetical protein